MVIEEKHSSEFWHMLYMIKNQVIVLDPDGWDRKNWEESWNEPITWQEFNQRLMMSTIYPVEFDHVVKSFRVFLMLVIGENDEFDVDETTGSNNELREEQRKRAGL